MKSLGRIFEVNPLSEDILILQKNRKKIERSVEEKSNSKSEFHLMAEQPAKEPTWEPKGEEAIPTLGAQLTNLTTIKLSRIANHLCIVCFVRFIQSSYLPPIPTQI